jgi:enterochelin esterase-like enzyme
MVAFERSGQLDERLDRVAGAELHAARYQGFAAAAPPAPRPAKRGDAVTHNFRAASAPQRWGLMGYSTGGFCAAKLALQYPRLYGAAVSLSGYFAPTSPLLTRSPQLGQQDSPLVLIRHKHPVALLLAASRQDPGTVNQIQAMAAAAQPPTRLFTYIVPKGGHNTQVWSAMLPTAYQWLTRQLGNPTR